ncbi:outer membrane beta-barrel protein [Rudanella lutea]|uniref:outer membrane beta-barrel protein n=1 Tax=Rudanella lutea TaxID=451374 RepID=UPI00037F9799|nr:outer membrane beta-barrel protein [Rudanella lutea]
MKTFILTGLLCLLMTGVFAQSAPARFNLLGKAVDTSAVALNGATVMLLTPKDSALVNFTRTSETGAFQFKNLKRGTYLLKISYVGSIPFNRTITPPDGNELDLGELKLKPITKELFEVVVKTARAPLTIKGDTIEYNAATFKVPPGSTVEELLRKLPGVQVDQEGNIRAQGQEVKRVTVDGKSFFGSDPKMATKNLPADAISKVQVFTDKSEQAKITGVDDGKKEKTVNLELKDNFKKGGFGKLVAGGGSDLVPDRDNRARGEIKGNYNKFDTKQQFSVIGLANNTNQTGLSWNDYQDFRGSNSFNWNDEADFGFNGGRFIMFGDDQESLSIPVTGGRGRGFSDNQAGGANYNYDTKKTKLSSNYYYSRTRLSLDALRSRENFLPGNLSILTADTSGQINVNSNHRGSIRFEQALDSMSTLIFLNNSRFGTNSGLLQAEQSLFRNGETLTTRNIRNNTSSGQSLGMANTLLFRRKFKTKGRNFAASASILTNTSESQLDLNTSTQFFENPRATLAQRQDQRTNSVSNEYKASLLFTEPFKKKFFWESFYNFSLRRDVADRDVYDRMREGSAGQMPRLDSLSLYYENNYLYNRLGTSVRYSHKGINLTVGAAAQRFDLDGEYANDQSSFLRSKINRTFMNIIPSVGLNYDLKNNRYLNFNYSVNTQMPSARDLQPIVDNSNPLFIRQGNPNLLPSQAHNLWGGFSYFNPGSFTNFWGNINYNYFTNQVVYNQVIDPTTLVTTTRPENISGGFNVGAYTNFSFPLKKTKSNLGFGTNTSYGENLLYINRVLNTSKNQNYTFRARLDLTPVDWFTLYANGEWGIQKVNFSVDTRQNQTIYNYTYGGEMNIRLPGDFYINSNLNYRVFINERFGFNQHVPILNASVYKILGKEKRWEVRGTLYDALNRNLGVNLSAFQNFVTNERVQTISRYGMLTLTYNMRGVKAQMKRQGF